MPILNAALPKRRRLWPSGRLFAPFFGGILGAAFNNSVQLFFLPPPQKKTRPRPAANWLQSPKRAGALGAAQRGRALLYFAELANRRLPKNKRLATGAGMGLKGRP